MYPNYSKTFLDLEDVLIRKVIQADSFLQIHIETHAAEQTCPCCGKKTRRVHDYRLQKIQDIPNLGKQDTTNQSTNYGNHRDNNGFPY